MMVNISDNGVTSMVVDLRNMAVQAYEASRHGGTLQWITVSRPLTPRERFWFSSCPEGKPRQAAKFAIGIDGFEGAIYANKTGEIMIAVKTWRSGLRNRADYWKYSFEDYLVQLFDGTYTSEERKHRYDLIYAEIERLAHTM